MTWKPGFRHCIEQDLSDDTYHCVDCGVSFEEWPDDSEECFGPYREKVDVVVSAMQSLGRDLEIDQPLPQELESWLHDQVHARLAAEGAEDARVICIHDPEQDAIHALVDARFAPDDDFIDFEIVEQDG